MSGVNKVILVGNLGSKPEVKYSGSGVPLTNFSVATSETWTDKNTGEKQEKTEWHRITIIGKSAEIAAQYLDKGSKIYVEGKLQTRKWQDKDGQDRYTTEVSVGGYGTSFQMLDRREGMATGSQSASPNNMSNDTVEVADNSGFDDDIPF